MRYILALDSGGTKCESLLFREDGVVLGSGHSDGLQIPGAHSIGGAGRSLECIAAAGNQALAGRECEELLIVNTYPANLEPIGFPGARIAYGYFDEGSAALALVDEDAGIVALAGTGAVVMARTRDNRVCHLDGLGPTLGDYGSGYHIGSLALRAAARSGWHPRHRTSLDTAVRQALNIDGDDPTGAKLVPFGLRAGDRSEVAGLAKLVVAAASDGDRIATSILHQTSAAMAETVFDLLERLDITSEDYALVGAGGVICRSPIYWGMICDKVHRFAPNLRPIVSDLPPVVGVGVLALKSAYPEDWRPRAKNLRSSARGALICNSSTC